MVDNDRHAFQRLRLLPPLLDRLLPALREAYNLNLPKITAFYTDFGQDERLFTRYRMLAAASSY